MGKLSQFPESERKYLHDLIWYQTNVEQKTYIPHISYQNISKKT
jgi:hypothetical protein